MTFFLSSTSLDFGALEVLTSSSHQSRVQFEDLCVHFAEVFHETYAGVENFAVSSDKKQTCSKQKHSFSVSSENIKKILWKNCSRYAQDGVSAQMRN